MPRGLIRFERTGNFHFLTCSCYHRFQHLGTTAARDLFEEALERVRPRYRFVVAGYVVMPEHIHLLLGEPVKGTVSSVVHALKLSVAMRRAERPFWQARYYDFIVHNEEKRVKSFVTCTAIPSYAAWWRNQKTGHGRAFAITQPGSRDESRSSRIGQPRGGATSCRNICASATRPIEICDQPAREDFKNPGNAIRRGLAIPGAQKRGTRGNHFCGRTRFAPLAPGPPAGFLNSAD